MRSLGRGGERPGGGELQPMIAYRGVHVGVLATRRMATPSHRNATEGDPYSWPIRVRAAARKTPEITAGTGKKRPKT